MNDFSVLNWYAETQTMAEAALTIKKYFHLLRPTPMSFDPAVTQKHNKLNCKGFDSIQESRFGLIISSEVEPPTPFGPCALQTGPAFIINHGQALIRKIRQNRLGKNISVTKVNYIRVKFFNKFFHSFCVNQIKQNLFREEPGSISVMQ